MIRILSIALLLILYLAGCDGCTFGPDPMGAGAMAAEPTKRNDSLYSAIMKSVDSLIRVAKPYAVRCIFRLNDISHEDITIRVKSTWLINGKYYVIPDSGKPFWCDNVIIENKH
jgi:hypothetical protein